jgi:hypothetical protein
MPITTTTTLPAPKRDGRVKSSLIDLETVVALS